MKKQIETIAILPIKKHSARVENKNFKSFAGSPLWVHAINELIASEIVDEIIINTDAPEIFDNNKLMKQIKKETNKEHCVITIEQRDESVCGDDVSMDKVIESILDNHKNASNFIQIHATTPFLGHNTLVDAFSFIDSSQYDSVHSVSKYQSRFCDEFGKPLNHDPYELIKTQDLSAIYEENSAFYMFTREAFDLSKKRICGNYFQYQTSEIESIDIDTEQDWYMAECVALGMMLKKCLK